MLVLYVRSQSKLSADTFLNPAVGVAEGSLAGETALKRCHDRRGHCGQRSRRSSIAECLHLAYQDNTNRKFFSYHLPSDESIRGETDLGLVNTVLTCPLRQKSWTFWLLGFMPPIFVPQGNTEMVARNAIPQSGLDWTVSAYRI